MNTVQLRILIFFLFFYILSFLFLSFRIIDVPPGINGDEAAIGYNAALVAREGHDQSGRFLPLFVSAFNLTDWKQPITFYSTVLAFKLFDISYAVLRQVSVVIILISATFFLFLGLFFLFKFQKINKKFLGILSSFFLALSMYFYTAHTIIVPLILLSFALIFRKYILIDIKKYLFLLFWWVILVIPLLLIIMTNPQIRFRASSVSIFQDINLGKKNIFEYSADKFLDQLTPSYLFGNGLDLTYQGPIDMGPLMFIQLPLVILGIIYMVKNPKLKLYWIFLISITLIAMVPAAISFEKFSPHRSETAFVILSIFSAFGLHFFGRILKFKNQFLNYGILAGVVTLFILNFIYFVSMYTVNYPYEKSQNLHYPFKQISQFAWSKYWEFDSIIIDPKYGQHAPSGAVAVQYYLAYYGNYKPDKLQKELQIKTDGMAFDKFSIRGVNWASDKDLKNTLIFASPWSLPLDFDKSKIIKTFNFYDGQLAYFAIKL